MQHVVALRAEVPGAHQAFRDWVTLSPGHLESFLLVTVVLEEVIKTEIDLDTLARLPACDVYPGKDGN